MVASQARPAYIYDTTLGDWVPMSGVVDTGQAYTFAAHQTFNGGIGATSTLDLKTGGTTRLSVDSSGRVTLPYQPAFLATKSDDGNQLAAGTYPFNVAVFNTGGHYSTSQFRFTAPVAGKYFFTYGIQLYGVADTSTIITYFMKNGSQYPAGDTSTGFRSVINKVSTTYHNTATLSGVIDLSVSDYVSVYHTGSRGMQSHFSGYLVG